MADVRCQLGGGQLHVRQGRPPADRQEEDAPSPGEEQTNHLQQVQNFMIGTSIRYSTTHSLFKDIPDHADFSPVLEFGDVITPSTRVHVDLAGVAIVNEDFIVNTSFMHTSQLNKQ